jgi:hypothetical protein
MIPFVGHQGIGEGKGLFFDFIDPIRKMHGTAPLEKHDFVKIPSSVWNRFQFPFQIGLYTK